MSPSPDANATRWTLIARAADSDAPDVQALNELMTQYLPVLRGVVRRWPTLDEATGEDLVQSFVQKRILEKNLLGKVDRDKGRFRTFLYRSFRNHIADELRKQRATRRSPGDGNLVSYDEVEGGVGRESDMEMAFHVSWVRHVLEEACRQMEDRCRTGGRMDCWLVFEARLKAPLLEGRAPMPYADLVDRLKLASPTQASNLLVTAKRMMRGILENLIRETVDNPEDLAAEWSFLKEHLG